MAPTDTGKAIARKPSRNGAVASGSVPVFTGEAACIVDTNRHIRAWNSAAERLTGMGAREAVGQFCFKVLMPNSQDPCRHCCPLSSRNGKASVAFDLMLEHPLGQRTVNVSTVLVGNGGQRFVMHLLRDVTEERCLQMTAGEALNCNRPDIAGADKHCERERIHLTKRQEEVLRLLAKGMNAKHIAVKLGLTECTVRNHIRAILLEMGVNSQLEALATACRLGLVSCS